MENIRSTSTTVNYIGIGANTKITDCDGFVQRNCRL